jgi:glucose/mannose-6-phosphate isomerase
MHKMGFTDDSLVNAVRSSIQLLDENEAAIKTEAKQLAETLFGKIPIIYTTDRMESVAVRFRQQINENAKMLCWHHIVPEMNHNELVGWRIENKDLAVVYLLNDDDYPRNLTRININKEIISNYTDTIVDVHSKGNNLVEKAMYLVHLVDWASVYLSDLRGVDSIEVDVIDYLKGELARV